MLDRQWAFMASITCRYSPDNKDVFGKTFKTGAFCKNTQQESTHVHNYLLGRNPILPKFTLSQSPLKSNGNS
jgi:hypothetical protein